MIRINQNIYLTEANYEITRILSLMDRNKFSKTYGCFDRNYWHYKIKDFASGMSQEFTLALSLACRYRYDGNPYYGDKRIREYVTAAIYYMIRTARKDGSDDDYFPYERALGAAVFSLYAITESYLLMNFKDEKMIAFFEKRAAWIMKNNESGTLSNHHAIAATALYNMYLITKKEIYKTEADRKITEVLGWQTAEGWYLEYEGCSPGYLTVSIDYLAQYYMKSKDERVMDSLKKAVDFVYEIQHPDGTIGGEYGSRFVYICHPCGFEIIGSKYEKALRIANSYLRAKALGLIPNVADDYIIGHALISKFHAFGWSFERKNFVARNEKTTETKNRYFKESGFYITQKNKIWGIFNLNKGACGKVFKNNQLVYNDSGVILKSGKQLAVSSLIDANSEIKVSENKIEIRKPFLRYKQNYATQLIFLMFRSYLFVLGKIPFSSKFLRAYLQRKMIVGKKPMPFDFYRKIEIDVHGVKIRTEVEGENIDEIALTTDMVPIYTAVSECFQLSMLDTNWKPLEKVDGKYVLVENITQLMLV